MVERREKPINQPRPQGASVPGFVSGPTSKTREKRPGDEAAHQYFSDSNDKGNEIRKHIREKRIRETGLPRRGNSVLLTQYVALYFFTPGCQNFRDERHSISLIFIQKSRPCVLHTNKKKKK